MCFKTMLLLKQCYTIEKYKTASKYMKLKTIEYLKETKKNFTYVESVKALLKKNILIVKNILKNSIVLYQ